MKPLICVRSSYEPPQWRCQPRYDSNFGNAVLDRELAIQRSGEAALLRELNRGNTTPGVIVASVPGGFHVVHGTFETADDYTFKPCEAFCEARSPLE